MCELKLNICEGTHMFILQAFENRVLHWQSLAEKHCEKQPIWDRHSISSSL